MEIIIDIKIHTSDKYHILCQVNEHDIMCTDSYAVLGTLTVKEKELTSPVAGMLKLIRTMPLSGTVYVTSESVVGLP